MCWRLSRAQWLAFAMLVAIFFVLGFWPSFGPPRFRYTGCDIDRGVWNLGWPLATCIVDAEAAKTFNVGPEAYVWGFALLVSLAGCVVACFAWNNRAEIAVRWRYLRAEYFGSAMSGRR